MFCQEKWKLATRSIVQVHFWITPANTRSGEHEAIADVELLTIRLGIDKFKTT